MIRDKHWLQKELSKIVIKNFNQTAFVKGDYPILGSYTASEVDKLVSQLGEPIEKVEQQNLFEEDADG